MSNTLNFRSVAELQNRFPSLDLDLGDIQAMAKARAAVRAAKRAAGDAVSATQSLEFRSLILAGRDGR